MATYYVGPGGNDANPGFPWAQRKLTLQGAENIPVAANDIVRVGPGTYRELLTCGVSGAAGQPIQYIGDWTGEHTDGIGGLVRITGSNNDLVAARNNCIFGVTRSYRTFSRFAMDTTLLANVYTRTGAYSNWILEDCFFQGSVNGTEFQDHYTEMTTRRCFFFALRNYGMENVDGAGWANAQSLAENNVFLGCGFGGFNSWSVGGWLIRNSSFIGNGIGVLARNLPGGFTPVTVNNSILYGHNNWVALLAGVLGMLVEDFNTFHMNGTDRINVAVGANSVNRPPLFEPIPLLNTGRLEAWHPFSLMAASQIRNLAGAAAPTMDLYGTPRPQETNIDWGAVENFVLPMRDAPNARGGAGLCLRLDGRSYHDIKIPVQHNTAHTITIWVRWDNDAGIGLRPQAILLGDYGVPQTTANPVGVGLVYEMLTIGPFTPMVPDLNNGFMVLRLVNRSTAAGVIATFFDDLAVN